MNPSLCYKCEHLTTNKAARCALRYQEVQAQLSKNGGFFDIYKVESQSRLAGSDFIIPENCPFHLEQILYNDIYTKGV